MLKRLSIAALLSLLAGCAGPMVESLAPTARHEDIVLTDPISTVSYRGLNYRCEEGATPGVYHAQREDAEGVYYFGPERSIWMTNESIQPTPRYYVGGIYLPHDTTKAPQFFYLFETTVHTASDVINSNAAAGALGPKLNTGAGVAGGVIAGALIGGMLEANVGAIEKFPPIASPEVRQKLRSLVRPAEVAPQTSTSATASPS